MTEGDLALHATCVVLAEAGVLIRGEAGAGKSTLARRLVSARRDRGGFASLVADDRVLVGRRAGRLVARPHGAIAGLAEHRGLGLLPRSYEEAAILRLVVDLTDAAPRLPEEADLRTAILGVTLPRVAGRPRDAEALVEEALSWQR